MFSRRTTNRGFTLVELLVVIGVSSIVLGGLGALYGHVAAQMGEAVAAMATTDQATTALRDVEWSVRNALLCETRTLNGATALRCKMPSAKVDLDGDGNPDSYAPSSLDKFGREGYAVGERVWYYLADGTGTFGTSGGTLWRAVMTSDANPTAASRDLAWTFLYRRTTSPRFPLVTEFSATVDAETRLVSLTLAAESVARAERRPASGEAAGARRGIRLSSQIFWGNWRT